MKYTVDQILAAMERHEYRVFTGEWNVNLLGVRTAEKKANTFNDYICVLFQHLGRWEIFAFPGTTDPGLFYRQNPLNERGTAVVAPGQHRRCWTFGKHRGRYEALVQRGPMSVYRDNNHDDVIDTTGPDGPLALDTGLHGINLHRARVNGQSFEIGKWSAGCQVIRAPWDYDLYMAICRRAAVDWGPWFSYTLLDEAALAKP